MNTFVELTSRLYAAAEPAQWAAAMTALTEQFGRPRPGRDFADVNVAALQQLLRHLTVALDLSLRLTNARTLTSAQSLLDAMTIGAFLVDGSAQPQIMNRRAREILAEHDGLTLTVRGLSTRSPRKNRGLRHAIAQIADGRPRRLLVWRCSMRPPLLLSIVPIAGATPFAVSPSSHAAIFIRELCSGGIDTDIVAEYYRLTPREVQVARLVAEGNDVADIAQLLSIGIGTVRTHLKHLFEKTGTNSQRKLALTLHSFADERLMSPGKSTAAHT